MDKLVGFFRNVSLVLFLGVSLYVYAILPSSVFVYLNEGEKHMVDREAFFYSSVVVFFFMNLLIQGGEFYVFRKMGSSGRLPAIWLTGFATVLNLFLALAVVAVLAANIEIGFSGEWLFYAGMAIVILWLTTFLFVFRKPRPAA